MPTYAKDPKTYAEQIALLESRGLTVSDKSFAENCLVHHNYYRLSAYRFPLSAQGNPDQFLPQTTFEDLWGLYAFDRLLRQIVLEACKRVEISVRSRWAYEVSHKHGRQAYENPAHFSDAVRHTQTLAKLDQELARSKEVFVAHFKNTYGTVRPPIWAACEVMAFGQISNFYAILADPSLRQAIAVPYQMDEVIFTSFLHHLNTVRNTCAHHSRLWNRSFVLTFRLPRTTPAHLIPSLHPAAPRNLYNTLVILAHLMDLIDLPGRWRHRVRDLIQSQSFPVSSHMGFPSNWLARPIWQP